MTLYPKLIMDALAKVRYPGTGKDLVTMGMVEDNIRIDGNKVSFSLLFEKPNDPFIKSVVKKGNFNRAPLGVLFQNLLILVYRPLIRG